MFNIQLESLRWANEWGCLPTNKEIHSLYTRNILNQAYKAAKPTHSNWVFLPQKDWTRKTGELCLYLCCRRPLELCSCENEGMKKNTLLTAIKTGDLSYICYYAGCYVPIGGFISSKVSKVSSNHTYQSMTNNLLHHASFHIWLPQIPQDLEFTRHNFSAKVARFLDRRT